MKLFPSIFLSLLLPLAVAAQAPVASYDSLVTPWSRTIVGLDERDSVISLDYYCKDTCKNGWFHMGFCQNFYDNEHHLDSTVCMQQSCDHPFSIYEPYPRWFAISYQYDGSFVTKTRYEYCDLRKFGMEDSRWIVKDISVDSITKNNSIRYESKIQEEESIQYSKCRGCKPKSFIMNKIVTKYDSLYNQFFSEYYDRKYILRPSNNKEKKCPYSDSLRMYKKEFFKPELNIKSSFGKTDNYCVSENLEIVYCESIEYNGKIFFEMKYKKLPNGNWQWLCASKVEIYGD